MTDDERVRFLHQQMHEKHKGHEDMHAAMLLILVITLIVSQFALFEWKKRHYKSYLFVSLLALWLIPLGISLRNFWWRFVIFWAIYSFITCIVLQKSFEKPARPSTPRLVYKWFLLTYKISYALGIIGYLLMMMTFVGFNLIFNQTPQKWMDVSLLFVFYGLYYGVLGRDLSELCTDKIAIHIGYYNIEGITLFKIPKTIIIYIALFQAYQPRASPKIYVDFVRTPFLLAKMIRVLSRIPTSCNVNTLFTNSVSAAG
jgi:RING finger protein 121/175